MKRPKQDKQARINKLLKAGFSLSEINKYLKEEAEKKIKKEQLKNKKVKKPVIFYGYNTVKK